MAPPAAGDSTRRRNPGVPILRTVALLAAGAAGLGWAGGLSWCVGRSRVVEPSTPPTRLTARATGVLERTDRASEWRLGVGRAIDVLRTNVPALLSSTDPVTTADYSIFHGDLAFLDARAPSFQLQGLPTYQRFISTLQWSLSTTCEKSQFEITAMRPPVNNEVYMRWRLKLWPKDMLSTAKGLFATTFEGLSQHMNNAVEGEPVIIEGYSRYEFDPWSAEIVKHTIDITNPPIPLMDLMPQAAPATWGTPAGAWNGLPQMRHTGSPSTHSAAAAAPFASGSSLVGVAAAPTVLAHDVRASSSAVARKATFGMIPRPCEDDFECNGGTANYPLQCCAVPLLGNFCCEPDDFVPQSRDPAYVPLPVPTDDRPY